MNSIKLKFSLEIEKLKEQSPDASYLEIISEYAEKNEIDFADIKKLLTTNLINKLLKESKMKKLMKDNTIEMYDSNMKEML